MLADAVNVQLSASFAGCHCLVRDYAALMSVKASPLVYVCSQVAASVCELIMPYFYSKIICSISKPGFQEAFRQNLVWYGAFALGFAVFAAARGALFGIINNKLSRALR